MVLQKETFIYFFGRITGFIFMYFLFTTIFYFILKLTDKFPTNWGYIHIIFITLLLILTGRLIKRWLK